MIEHAWTPRFVCPDCGGPVENGVAGGARCRACSNEFPLERGVLRMLPPSRAARLEPFVDQYLRVRDAEGYRAMAPESYRCLPTVPPEHPHAAEWHLRRESFTNFQRCALPSWSSAPLRVLDVGGGCGWLSHRLAAAGHTAVAVDCLADPSDGLEACRHYAMPIVAVQADFDRLPFEAGQFDVLVFNAALHYSPNPPQTIAAAARLLAPGGTLAIMDSPLFVREADGEAMVRDQLARIASAHRIEAPVRPGLGYLTFAGVERACEAAGLRASFIRSRGMLPWRMRRQLARLKLRRAPAAFGVWVAR